MPYIRLNTEYLLDYTLELRPLERTALLTRDDKIFDLSAVSAVWYRRPDPPEVSSATMSLGEEEIVRAQWRNALRGLVHVLEARWVNDPDRNDVAEQKILQLRMAAEVGFNVPPTVITNSKRAVDAFSSKDGDHLILKALDAPYIEEEDGSGRFVFTTRLRDAPLGLAGLDQAPMIFQREIAPKRDVRVTVIGDRVLGATATGDLPHVDWRSAQHPPAFAPVEIPSDIDKMSVEFVKRFGLVFGALDFAVDEAGAYWFFELNPNGEWGWLQKAGLPIAEAITMELTGRRP